MKMQIEFIGKIVKLTGEKVLIKASSPSLVNSVYNTDFILHYVSVGSLIGTRVVDNRILVLTVEELYESVEGLFLSGLISGIYDEIIEKFTFGTNIYPLIGENVFKLQSSILSKIFAVPNKQDKLSIGTYFYDPDVDVEYEPNVLFGKHLGIFGNTGSGKTCTVVSIIQNYTRKNKDKDIKFVILDVNGEYKNAFNADEAEYIPFEKLRLHHSILENFEYAKLFNASDGVQAPALIEAIEQLREEDQFWNIEDLTSTIRQLKDKQESHTRSLCMRIEGYLHDDDLMNVINRKDEPNTVDVVFNTDKKIIILNLQVSSQLLDIVSFLLFKSMYVYKVKNRDSAHLSLVLEEAHRYIKSNMEDNTFGNYYIDKLSREGRKYGLGLIISSQIPSMLAYEVVSQCNSVIMHKVTNQHDLDFLRNVLRISNGSFFLQLSALRKQYAIVCGEAFPNDTIVRICEANPLPRSEDPVIKSMKV